MGEYLPSAASNSAEVLLTCLQPSRSKKNADNKILMSTWYLLISRKHLIQSMTEDFGVLYEEWIFLRIDKIIYSFFDSIMVCISDQINMSEAFTLTSVTKHGCTMAPFVFTIIFSLVILYCALKNCRSGLRIKFRKDDGSINLQCF